MANLKVLMMGGRRCGKTSALASLFEQMIHGKINEFLTVCDKTVIDPTQPDAPLQRKLMEIQHLMHKMGNNTFLADKNPNASNWVYTIQLRMPGKSKGFEIDFIDTIGSFFTKGSAHYEQLCSYTEQCDIFVVIIDTPYLMAGSKLDAEIANEIDGIQNFFAQITNREESKHKQVLFVPVKCEKWVKEGKIDDVVKTVEEYYDAIIKDLIASNKTEISIIPIETAGDIIFAELTYPYMLFDSRTYSQKICAKISDSEVRVADGRIIEISEDAILAEDPSALYKFGNEISDIVRPNAWFKLRNEPQAAYTPHNCEQLILHILRFSYNKMLAERLCNGLSYFFSNLSLKNMQEILDSLSQANLIKDSGEGIKIIKRCF